MLNMLLYQIDCPSIFDVIPQINKLIKECSIMNLSDLVAKNGVVKNVVYDKDFNVSFDLMFLGRSQLQQMLGRNTKIAFDARTHGKEEKLDSEALSTEIANTCVKGWHGVTYKWLSTLFVLELPEGTNMDEELAFSTENLQYLMKNAYGLDSWLLDTVRDAANFNEKKEAERKN